jgi:bifunctional enzyme CysN/CysC
MISNIFEQKLSVSQQQRSQLKGQSPCVFWMTGLSGAGKSTIANALEQKLHELGKHTYVLDGDNIRNGLSKDLGFAEEDRVENLRRIAEVAKLMVDAGLIVIASFISPFESERKFARSIFKEGEFFEVFIDAPLDVVEQRDTKGLYKRARAGEIKDFTGISSPFESPSSPEIHIHTDKDSVEEAVGSIIERIR